MHKKNDEYENAKYSFLTASARGTSHDTQFNTTLVLNAKIKIKTSHSFVGGHLKVHKVT